MLTLLIWKVIMKTYRTFKLSILVFTFISTFISTSTVSANTLDKVKSFEQKINHHKGEVIYIDFWASWCIPCRQSFPWMNEMQAKHKSAGFKVITINLDSDKKNADDFLLDNPAKFDIVYDPQGELAKKFKLKGMPNSFIINRAGKMVSAHVGFNDIKRVAYEKEISALLGQN
mgnify:CR=1 FL=1